MGLVRVSEGKDVWKNVERQDLHVARRLVVSESEKNAVIHGATRFAKMASTPLSCVRTTQMPYPLTARGGQTKIDGRC